jgi:hypothetical protein
VVTLLPRNENVFMVAPAVGSGEISVKGSLESGDQVCVGTFGSNLDSVAMKTIVHLI